ncbi:ARM repeat-containing protein [Cylindrobasidium torrendii FP15055 ss-10]|uniref:ARM repeat-containing protein n=1 Tax=Cylindrobasidium torrendii FP15055 ss-10 TaxID=1314674 RepID=A0A0D7BC52_9AGAR|nr:ARM repeat-containing protein [Cylindrobasidium torrendii FP15055 ss-10]
MAHISWTSTSTAVQFGCMDEDNVNISPVTESSAPITTQAKPFKIESFGSVPASSTTYHIVAPSAFTTARFLSPLESVDYPEGVHGPVMAASNATDQRVNFRYDLDFLLQFQSVGIDKPDGLPSHFHCVAPLTSSAMVRKFRELVHKLSEGNFDFVSSQLISLANEPGCASNGQKLAHLTRVLSECATRPSITPALVGIYARLCGAIMEGLSPAVQDQDITNTRGIPLSSINLFRGCLLNQIKEDFERFCLRTKRYSHASNPGRNKEIVECKGIRVARFLGELFKSKMTVAMGRFVRTRAKILIKVDNLEDTIEPLCELLVTAGERLEDTRAQHWEKLNDCFTRMEMVCKREDISLRLRKRLQGVIDLRTYEWTPRNQLPNNQSEESEASSESESSMCAAPLPSESVPVANAPVCKYHLKGPGQCTFGIHCRKSHPDALLPSEVLCKWGSGCRYKHNGKCIFLHDAALGPHAYYVRRGGILQNGIEWLAESHLDGDDSAGGVASTGDRLKILMPVVASANRRWDRKALANADDNSPEVVDRKVKSLLNKLSLPIFDSISDQIISWANKSENEKNGQTLIQVIRLVFEKATDEAAFSEIYARLCRKMMEQISSKVQDESIKNQDGKPIAGGQLFRRYLLNRCQEDFEYGWAAKENATAEENSKHQLLGGNANGDEEIALYSDEYYVSQKAKRRGLGLVKFIGELFKLQMLTERIMHECVKRLLGNVENPEEEGIESLCKLLTTVGEMLDTPKAKADMDAYFSTIKKLRDSNTIHLRIQLMLQNILELRERKWLPRNLAVVAPPAVQEQAADATDKQPQPGEVQTIPMSRSAFLCGDEPEGAESTISSNRWPVPSKSKRSATPEVGKTTSRKKSKRKRGTPRSDSPSPSAAQMSSQQPQSPTVPSSPEQAPMRRKLILAPRSKPIKSASATSVDVETTATESPGEETAATSDADAKHIVDEDLERLFALRNLAEVDDYFQRLPAAHHHFLVGKLVSKALKSTQGDAELVGDLFRRVREKNLAEVRAFEEGFASTLEVLVPDVVIDASKAHDLMVIMMKGVDFDEGTRMRLTLKMPKDSESPLARFSSPPECGQPALGCTRPLDINDGVPPAQDFHPESPDEGTVSEVLTTRVLVWALYSETDKDVQGLFQLSKDIRDAAVETPASSAAHARMCRVLVENIHPCVQDPAVVDNEGMVLAGGELFRKQLRDGCNHALLRMFPAASAGTYSEVLSRQSKVGLTRFIAELLKVEVLSKQDVHRYIRGMLTALNKSYDEDGLESLCVLLNHSGKVLECSRIGSTLVNDYLLGIQELVAKASSSSRMQTVLQSTLELRRHGWSI